MLDTWYKLHIHQPSKESLAATLYLAKGGSPEVFNFEVDLTKIERAVRAMHQCLHDSRSCAPAIAGDFDDDELMLEGSDEVGRFPLRLDKHIGRTAKAAVREGKRAVTTRPDKYVSRTVRRIARNKLVRQGSRIAKGAARSREVGAVLGASAMVPGLNVVTGPAFAGWTAAHLAMLKYDNANKIVNRFKGYYKDAKRYVGYGKKVRKALSKTSTKRSSIRSAARRLKRKGELSRSSLSRLIRARKAGRSKLLGILRSSRSKNIIRRGKSAQKSLFRLGFSGGKFRISRPSSKRRSSSKWSRARLGTKRVRRVSRSKARRHVRKSVNTVKDIRSRMKKLAHAAKYGRTASARAKAQKALAVMHIAARNLARQKVIKDTRRKVMAARVLSRPPRNREEARKRAVVVSRLRAKQKAEANRGYLIDDYGTLHQGNFALRSLEGPQSEMLVTANASRSGDFERV